MLLDDIVNKKHYAFYESFETWQDAIRGAAKPLLDDNTIEEKYVNAIIECVNKYGPYIIITTDVAMPHSTLGCEGVNDTAIGFARVKKPVVFDLNGEHKEARLFFTLAAVDNEKHLQNMMMLADMLSSEDIINDLLTVNNEEEILNVARKYKIF